MSNKARNTSGKFAAKSEAPRKVRSVNLTDIAWQWLAEVAAQAGVSRNDYLEAMAEGNTPLMETVEVNDTDTAQQPDSELSPLIETVEIEDARAEYNALLESSAHVTNKLRQELAEVRSQLATERADREEVECQLSDREKEVAEVRSQLEEAQKVKEVIESAPVTINQPQLPDLKTCYEGYKQEKKPGRTFTINELKPFYIAILKRLTPEKGN